MGENLDLPLADKAATIESYQRYELMSEIYHLIDKNPSEAYEIAQHAMQTEGLLKESSYPIIMCKAASHDERVVDLILEHMEENGFAYRYMFDIGNRVGNYIGHRVEDYTVPAFYYDLLREQMKKGKVEPARLFEVLRKESTFAPDPIVRRDWQREEYELYRAMAECVIEDPKLWDKFYAHSADIQKLAYIGKIEDLIKCCNNVALNNEILSKNFCDDVISIASFANKYDRNLLYPALKKIASNDSSYFYQNPHWYDNKFTQQIALKDHSLIPSLEGISKENFDAFAKIYEEYVAKTHDYNEEYLVGLKNAALGEDKKNQIMRSIKDKILDYGQGYGPKFVYDFVPNVSKPVQAWLVKNAQKFPNLVQDCLKQEQLPYVEMCIKHIKNPEKDNIASLLSRLEAKEGKARNEFYENRPEDSAQKFDFRKYRESLTFEDFQDAQDFVARRDMCMRACLSYVEKRTTGTCRTRT